MALTSKSSKATQTIPVLQEELHVGKRTIDTGRGVRVRKSVEQQEQTIDEALVRHEVQIERMPIGRMVDATRVPVTRHEGETLIVPILEEVLVVEKRLRLKEELRITRRQVQIRKPQTVTLRSEHVLVEHFNEPPEHRSPPADAAFRMATEQNPSLRRPPIQQAGDSIMNNTVIAVYDSHERADNALAEIRRAGFAPDHARILPEHNTPQSRLAALQEIGKFQEFQDREADEGWSLRQFFRSLFGRDDTDEHVEVYAEAVRRGNILILALTDSDQKREQATKILNTFNPIDIEERRTRWASEGWQRFDRGAPPLTEAEIERERSVSGQAQQQTAIPVIQEELRVGKRLVQRGGVRIFQHVTESPAQESVTLREEHVVVERHPVDHPASAADMKAFKEGSIEVRESAEEAVVEKTARVVEEVVVGKNVTQHTETVHDTVRRTDVDIEKMAPTPAQGRGEPARQSPPQQKRQ